MVRHLNQRPGMLPRFAAILAMACMLTMLVGRSSTLRARAQAASTTIQVGNGSHSIAIISVTTNMVYVANNGSSTPSSQHSVWSLTARRTWSPQPLPLASRRTG